jgi:hypothetical protein
MSPEGGENWSTKRCWVRSMPDGHKRPARPRPRRRAAADDRPPPGLPGRSGRHPGRRLTHPRAPTTRPRRRRAPRRRLPHLALTRSRRAHHASRSSPPRHRTRPSRSRSTTSRGCLRTRNENEETNTARSTNRDQVSRDAGRPPWPMTPSAASAPTASRYPDRWRATTPRATPPAATDLTCRPSRRNLRRSTRPRQALRLEIASRPLAIKTPGIGRVTPLTRDLSEF